MEVVGITAGLMQKRWKIQGGHDKIDWKSRDQIQKKLTSSTGGHNFFLEKTQQYRPFSDFFFIIE